MLYGVADCEIHVFVEADAKKQVQRMVGTLLGLPEPPSPDHAADALAVAICHGGGSGRRRAIEAAAEIGERVAG